MFTNLGYQFFVCGWILFAVVIFGYMKILFLYSIPSPGRSSTASWVRAILGLPHCMPFSPVRAAPPAPRQGLTGACLPTDGKVKALERKELYGTSLGSHSIGVLGQVARAWL